MLREAAVIQRGEDDFCASPSTLFQDGFCSNPRVYCLVAESDGEIVGALLYFFVYSTWTSRTGSYIEDLYVLPDYRRKGIARALMSTAATLALEAGCRYMQWTVLRTNSPAREFYESLGAFAVSEWALMRISGEELEQLSAKASEPRAR
jgi:GNAT superfamily N-acetyltransferase